MREVSAVVLSRQQKQCNFLEYKDKKVIYKRCVPLSWKGVESAADRQAAPCLGTHRCTFWRAWTRTTTS